MSSEDELGFDGITCGYKRECFTTGIAGEILMKMMGNNISGIVTKGIVETVKNLADELELQGEATWSAKWNEVKETPNSDIPPDLINPEEFTG